MKDNVATIVSECLCTACGACKAICPTKAISITENIAGYKLAKVDDDKCISCSLCRKSCPSDKEYVIKPTDTVTGKSIKAYLANSTNEYIRMAGQSGGVVTALLCYLIDAKKIDGAVVNRYDKENRRTEAYFTSSCEEVISSAGSKYTQSSVIPVIFEHNDKKLAAVTLGCQSESIAQIRLHNPKKIDNLEYVIGLICAGQNSGHIIDNLFSQFGLKAEEEEEAIFMFRAKDKKIGSWPGNVIVETPSNKYMLPSSKRKELVPVYTAYRCLLCYDKMNVFSDIVCGDPWGFEQSVCKDGYSVVISRTEKGQTLLEDACSAGYISMREISVDAIAKGQNANGKSKMVSSVQSSIKSKLWLFPYPDEFFSNLSRSKVGIFNRLHHIDSLMYARLYYNSSSKSEELLLSKKRYEKIKQKDENRHKIHYKIINFIERVMNQLFS